MRKTKKCNLTESVVKIAGDSGDGIQIMGEWFARCVASANNEFCSFPDFPAEIRAPAGTLSGVSGFQLRFGKNKTKTPGDKVDLLIAFNPAALLVNYDSLSHKARVIVDSSNFNDQAWKKLEYDSYENLMQDINAISIPITSMTKEATKDLNLSYKQSKKCKNMFALGIILWLYDQSIESTLIWIKDKYKKDENIVNANLKSLHAGYNFAITTELISHNYHIPDATFEPGLYTKITGNMAIAYALATSAFLSKSKVLLTGYPITPASDILHIASKLNDYDVVTMQLEDEVAAIGAAIGASYGGSIAVCCTSGPGFDLKAEAIGLAIMAELPLVVINVQRAGPSTGMPTKMQQSDLLSAVYGRHGESPAIVMAPNSAKDCFDIMLEAIRVSIKLMHPVIVLSDAMLANGSEPWRIPDTSSMQEIKLPNISSDNDVYNRNEDLAKNWVIPGTPNKMHTIGGLEKDIKNGEISYQPDNHQAMVNLRSEKVNNAKKYYQPLNIEGCNKARILLITWGSTYGVGYSALQLLLEAKTDVALLNLRYIYPLPSDLCETLNKFEKVIVVEHNLGQLFRLIKAETDIKHIYSVNKCTGTPFFIDELKEKILEFIC